MSYEDLAAHVGRVGAQLNSRGLGRGDCVAIVLRDGPEMATLFLAVASVATAAPLHPGYRAREYEHHFAALGIEALIVEAGAEHPAARAARRRGVDVETLPGNHLELISETNLPMVAEKLAAHVERICR